MKPAAADLHEAGWTQEIVSDYVEQENGRSEQPIIEANALSKRFGRTTVLKNITFSVYAGEILGIVGRSGAGKTTLLNVLAGLIPPDSGTLKHTKHAIGIGTQQPSFYPDLSVRENLLYYGRMARATRADVKQLVEDLGLRTYLDHPANVLSGGIQKKLDIAIAFLGNPDIILLDEPTSDLDPISRLDIWKFLKQHATNRTIIVASHQLTELEPLCARFAILHEGTIVGLGSADQFRERIGARYLVRVEFESHDYTQYARKHPGWTDTNTYVVTATTQDEVFSILKDLLESKESIVSVSVEHPSLRHLFSTLVQ